ncbi:hypothetical protein FGIG_02518 [Fasciola gigantica]|uniref:Secreted protein n=1 Tax=Fasciola gigantica TaxID=46835 RepID=A0A504YIJ7_FASGI|nr:hypothetical protein FGIG_02518 [Fasciola gigantica]
MILILSNVFLIWPPLSHRFPQSWTMTLHAQTEPDFTALDPPTPTDTCLPGLHAIRERVRVMCAPNAPTRSNNGLVGLNRITCQPNHGSDQDLIQQALSFGPPVDNYASTRGTVWLDRSRL